MEANNILFRCSSIGHIMGEGNAITEKQLEELAYLQGRPKPTDNQKAKIEALIQKRDNPPELTETVKTHLIDVFASHKYGRKEVLKNKFLDKGNEREEDSITLISRLLKIPFEKNTVRDSNRYVQGEWDMELSSDGKIIRTLDSKTSWSLHTFLRAKFKKLDPLYYWQGQGYMDLTGALSHTVCFCLVNGTAEAILAEKKSALYKMRDQDPTSSEFRKACQQIEINHIFDVKAFRKEYPGFMFDNIDVEAGAYDIPMQDRLHTFHFERNDEDIRKMHDRVLECREWMETNLFDPIYLAA